MGWRRLFSSPQVLLLNPPVSSSLQQISQPCLFTNCSPKGREAGWTGLHYSPHTQQQPSAGMQPDPSLLTVAGCVNWGMLLDLSEPQFPNWKMRTLGVPHRNYVQGLQCFLSQRSGAAPNVSFKGEFQVLAL